VKGTFFLSKYRSPGSTVTVPILLDILCVVPRGLKYGSTLTPAEDQKT